MYNKKVLNRATANLDKAKAPAKKKDIIVDPMGQWKYPGENTRIPGGNITMQGVSYPVLAQPNVGQPQMMYPGMNYEFPGADYVDEYPQMKKGGLKKNKTSRSLMATNKLFAKNFLFKKPGKNTIYDPNSPNYQDGGEQDAMDAMMKARLAYANEFGNPAAQRMINIPDNPYDFGNGNTGTHYMASMDNYAVPQIQDENGQLTLGDYGPDSNEAMRFDTPEDAEYFAEHYKEVSPGFIEAELTDAEIEEYRKGGYIVEDISIPSVGNYKKGGSLLTKYLQEGGTADNYFTVPGSDGVYRKVNGKWQVDWNRSGKFQPLSKGDVAKRTAVLNKQAKPLYDRDYNSLVESRSYEVAPKKVTAQPQTATQKKAQQNFNQNFKVSAKDNYTKVKDKIELDKENLIKWSQENNIPVDQKQLDDIENWGWNVYGKVGAQYKPDEMKSFTPDAPQGFLDKTADVLSNPMTSLGYFMRGQDIPDYMQRDMDRGTFGYYANGDLHTERNPFDYVSDFTPLGLVNDTRNVINGISEGDLGKTGLGLLSAVPGFSELRSASKALKAADKFSDVSKGTSNLDVRLLPDDIRSKELDMETFGIYKGDQRVGEVSGNRLSNGDFETMDIGVDPKFQKQGIGTETYRQLNESLPEGNKVRSWGAFVEENGVAPGRNTWQSLERQGLAKKNEKGIYEMTPNTFSNSNEAVKAGFDGNFITRPLTPFGKNELTPGNQWYRKIGNEAGLRDLIKKEGAQAPAPMRMKSGLTLDAPFFGRGSAPNESYKGLYTVELKPEAASKYNWRSRVAGVDNYGSVPFNNEGLMQNMPLEDLNVYRKKWFSNNYKQLDPNNLEKGLNNAALQRNLEGAYKWGTRGYLGKSAYDYVNEPNKKNNDSYSTYQKGGTLLTKKVTCKKCGWKWNAAKGGKLGPIHLNEGRKTLRDYVYGADIGMMQEQFGGSTDAELTDEEIQAYRDAGYYVEELD